MASNFTDDVSVCGKEGCVKMVLKNGVQCESCCAWYHVECAKMSVNDYKILSKTKSNAHWFCDQCDVKVMEILKEINDIKLKNIKLEKELTELSKSMEVYKKVNEAEITFLKINLSELRNSVSLSLTKDDIKELVNVEVNEFKEAVQQTQANEVKVSWSEIVAREVDNKLSTLTEDINVVQRNVTETRENMNEINDKERRRKNVIIYNVEENTSEDILERMNYDKTFCKDLFNEVLGVGYVEGDIVKVFRLGRKSELKRPLLVELKSAQVKNFLMENAGKLGRARGKFKGVTMSYDMTIKEREQCRAMVEEAKTKQANESSGDWVYKVRGPPGQMKVLKLRRIF